MYKEAVRGLTMVGWALLGCGGTVVFVAAGGAGGEGVAPSTGVATSTSTNTGTTTSNNTGTSTNTSTGPSTLTGTGPGTGTSPTCGQDPDCIDCCVESDPFALELINQYFFDACLCGNGAPCQMACEDTCDQFVDPGPACNGCLDNVFNNLDPCVEQYQVNCQNDPDCVPLLECVSLCP